MDVEVMRLSLSLCLPRRIQRKEKLWMGCFYPSKVQMEINSWGGEQRETELGQGESWRRRVPSIELGQCMWSRVRQHGLNLAWVIFCCIWARNRASPRHRAPGVICERTRIMHYWMYYSKQRWKAENAEPDRVRLSSLLPHLPFLPPSLSTFLFCLLPPCLSPFLSAILLSTPQTIIEYL